MKSKVTGEYYFEEASIIDSPNTNNALSSSAPANISRVASNRNTEVDNINDHAYIPSNDVNSSSSDATTVLSLHEGNYSGHRRYECFMLNGIYAVKQS